nr:HEPN domain-containing protein [Burkholderia sp. Tr-862]
MLGYEPERPTNILEIGLSEQVRQRLGACRYVAPQTSSGGLFGLGSEQRVSQVESIADSLRPYTALLSAGEENQDATRILTGLEWAFDADVERNETQALLNACIGIEAILGKSQETGLTDKLADRCAFMLGRGARQREQIASDFKKIYDARSKVVHGRRRRLQPQERGMLDQAKQLLRNILQREATEFAG